MSIDPETQGSPDEDFIPASRLAAIVRRPGLINGDPEDLAELDWSRNWSPDGTF